jgi:hypothetical protein
MIAYILVEALLHTFADNIGQGLGWDAGLTLVLAIIVGLFSADQVRERVLRWYDTLIPELNADLIIEQFSTELSGLPDNAASEAVAQCLAMVLSREIKVENLCLTVFLPDGKRQQWSWGDPFDQHKISLGRDDTRVGEIAVPSVVFPMMSPKERYLVREVGVRTALAIRKGSADGERAKEVGHMTSSSGEANSAQRSAESNKAASTQP